ncbi:hypothetical protein RHGRI_002634 [Rhododendron griersonianum]|uniref:TLC domain-containing protein n=1 Tax=Rhododendron griersonianum TaxID=479676 RepID=A0AAV6LST2_9ERIC|nr:hypothetical protein RHGRI_002634 [Rhododendron griersonianum]
MEIVTPSFPFDYESPAKEFNWLLSVFAGILICRTVYKLTGIVSPLFFNGYAKLNDAERIDWNKRGFSTFHALVVAVASFYLLLFSNLFDEGSRAGLIVNRRCTLSDTTLGISLGYFLSDLAMIVWQFPALGGLEFVLHHGLSIGSIFVPLVTGHAHVYVLMVLFTESTTPFVNLRWYLDVVGQKNSKLYTFNGVALFLMWLVARILLFIFFFYHMFTHLYQVKEVFPLGFYGLLVVPPMLAVMNLFWFWKITEGLVKTFLKARHGE